MNPKVSVFSVGDVVRLKDQSRYLGYWKGDLKIVQISKSTISDFYATRYDDTRGGFQDDEVELVEDKGSNLNEYVIYNRNNKSILGPFSTEQEALVALNSLNYVEAGELIIGKFYRRLESKTKVVYS